MTGSTRRQTRERRRVLGADVLVGDYFETPDAAALWRIEGVRIRGGDVAVTFASVGGRWQTWLRARECVHVWRLVERGR